MKGKQLELFNDLKKADKGKYEKIGQVPFLDLKAQFHQIQSEISERFADIIANTGFILGKHVDEFEKNFARLQESEYCIGVSSGTDALHIALQALGIGQGDEVIVPVNTFIATAEAVSLTGAIPVFIDCDEYYNIDLSRVREIFQETGDRRQESRNRRQGSGGRIQESGDGRLNIRAIIPVHLYGQPCDMDAVMALADEFDLLVVEDACQAHLARWTGRRVGNFGGFGAFSFYPGKNLGAFGEAGALVTSDDELYNRAKMLRQHGEIERYHHKVIGHNYRMEAFQGAVLATKLKYIEGWTRQRQENAALYNRLLVDVEGVEAPGQLEGTECVHHLYVIQTDRRDELQKYLGDHGVATGLHYPVPLHLQEAYHHLGYKKGDFPVAERAAGRILSLPMYPELTGGQIGYVCEKIRNFFGR